jgi:hypothetical protein
MKKDDSKFEFWLSRDILTAQRHKLKEARVKVQVAGAKHAPPPETNPRVTDPPAVLYKVESIYRFTRGNNDLTNPGMGYGELTEEAAWELQVDGTLKLRSFFVRRTRSGRKRVESAEATYVSHAGVISQYPGRRSDKNK